MTALPQQGTLPAGLNRARSMAAETRFRFRCHPGVSCFTECCRELELALSPYDLLRLRQALGLSSDEFLDRYAIIEFGSDDLYPKVYLAMVDDGRASCPFVDAAGCRVYADRPAACRTYPIGRGAYLDPDGHVGERFVLIREDHCLGFAEDHEQGVSDWQQGQGLADYHRLNDLVLALLAGNETRTLRRLSDEAAALFIDTLYRLETFAAWQHHHRTAPTPLPADGPELLAYAIAWLTQQWQPAP